MFRRVICKRFYPRSPVNFSMGKTPAETLLRELEQGGHKNCEIVSPFKVQCGEEMWGVMHPNETAQLPSQPRQEDIQQIEQNRNPEMERKIRAQWTNT